jgi:hypothetical protein
MTYSSATAIFRQTLHMMVTPGFHKAFNGTQHGIPFLADEVTIWGSRWLAEPVGVHPTQPNERGRLP